MDPAVWYVAEEDVTRGVNCRALGKLVPLADQFPTRIGIKDDVVADVMARAIGGLGDRPRIFAPEPAQRVGQNRRAVFAVVAFGANYQFVVVIGIAQGGAKFVIAVDVDILQAVLEKNAQRLGLHFSYQRRINVVAAQVGKSTNEAEHAMEDVRPRPGSVERRVASGTRAGDGAIIGIV